MTVNMARAQEIFLREVEQRLLEGRRALAALKDNGYSREAGARLYHFAHTLKGSGQMIKLNVIAQPATEMAVALSLIQDYGVEFGPGVLKFLSERIEEIQNEVARLRSRDSTPPPVPPIPTGQSKKILVIDDDYIVTKSVQEFLEEKGFTVTVCHDTRTAERYLAKEQPDLIVLDIILPGEDGIDFCRRIRSDYRRQIVPIIFLTVKANLQDKLIGFATGADDYLAKPFELEELTARIYAILNRLEAYQDLALQDELTGVYNRRYLYQRLEEEIARAKRTGSSFSLAMIDIDLFKNINDHYGHAAGDEALQYAVACFRESLRSTDVICRYGGEEFAVILPETPLSRALLVVERLRQNVFEKSFALPKSRVNISITISAGVAAFPGDGETSSELLAAADAAMYRAKKSGRNKVLPSEKRTA